MSLFLRLSLAYLLFAVALALLTRQDALLSLPVRIAQPFQMIAFIWRWIAAFGLALLVLAGLLVAGGRKIDWFCVIQALTGAIVFQMAFVLVKTSLSDIAPFFADLFFANADRWMHGGVDPYVFAYKFAEMFPVDYTLIIYLWIWLVPAIFFPVILAVSDGDAARVRRYLVLFAVAWAGIGNIGALAGLSAGPIYFDRIYGGERFRELVSLVADSGVGRGAIGDIQRFLWFAHQNTSYEGTGISAFPSVHVAMACVIALYVFERSGILAPLGFLFFATILFLSVYTGYHYAIDGYFSALVVILCWYILRRNSRLKSE